QDNVNITLGKDSEEGGRFAHIALDRAVRDLKDGHIDLLVTAPISKNAMQMAGFTHAGHTEYLAHEFNAKNPLMMMVADRMRVALATAHTPLNDVPAAITKEKLKSTLELLQRTLQIDFAIGKPTIAVLGLNPHAGESGRIGQEE